MDMIILAAIAAFIVYRLYITLGETTGFQGDEQSSRKVVDFQRKPLAVPNNDGKTCEEKDNVPRHLVKDVQRIKKIDTNFVFKDFLETAKEAFEVIMTAYGNGDRETLKFLLSKDVFETFQTTLTALEDQGHSLDITIVRIEEALVKDIMITDHMARIHMVFTTEQVPLVKDQAGDVIDGNPNQIDQVIDHWTFERDLKSSDCRWILVSTDES